MKTLVALFHTYEEAEKAVESLKEANFPEESLTVVARKGTIKNDPEEAKPTDDAVRMAGKGTLSGGVVGALSGLIVGLGAIVVPGLGPVIVGGALASALAATAAGAGIGAAAGGVVGALIGQGITEEEAEIYAEGVKRGGLLVMVRAEDGRAEIAHTLLENANAVDINRAAEEWRSSGWSRFEDTVEPDDTYPRLWGGMYNQR